MLKFFVDQVRGASVAGAGMAMALLSALIGVVWLAMALATAIAPYVGVAGSQAIIGGLFLIPAIVLGLSQAFRRKEAPGAQAQGFAAAQKDELAEIVAAAKAFATKQPLVAAAIVVLGGILALRFPSALSLLVQILAPSNDQGDAP
jgi:hypothetical protein